MNIKNRIKWFAIMAILCIACVHCTNYDEYKKYMPDGEIVYPQKPDSVKTYPGKNRIQLEWVIVDPKVTSCIVYYEHDGIQGSTIVPINAHDANANNTISVIISDLEETNYLFKIVSYDDFGHSSITVETEESVYGEMFENSLLNRLLTNSVFFVEEGLQLEWYAADEKGIGIQINYTDINDVKQTMVVDILETSTTISDFNINEPLFYSTMYKPVPTAIDTFYAQRIEKKIEYVPDWFNITSQVLKNTQAPFFTGEVVIDPRFYLAEDWIANEAAAANGNVDANKGHALVLWIWPDYSPAPSIDNGKLYQVVELEAGMYRFDVEVHSCSAAFDRAFVCATAGTVLSDFNNISQSLAYAAVPSVSLDAASKPTLSIEFEISEKSFVSLGFVVNIDGTEDTVINKVELWKWR